MRSIQLLLIVNTSTCWKTELHLSNLASCTTCLHIDFYVFSMVLTQFLQSMGPFNIRTTELLKVWQN